VVTEAAARGERVKVVGSGHSFTDVACTDGTMLVLDQHARLLHVDRVRHQVTVQAGVTLATLNRTLALYGLGLPNLGDIEYQTVAGAISTGTHGTGATLGCLATQVIGMELVVAAGSVLALGVCPVPGGAAAGPDGLFDAARVSLGALGVISAVTLQCVPAFNLRAQEDLEPLDDVLERFDDLADGNDHFEFYWMPRSQTALTKRNNRTEDPPRPRSRRREWLEDVVASNWGFEAVARLRPRAPRLARTLRRLLPDTTPSDYVDRSDRVFTSPRTVRFYEMEYGIPRPAAAGALAELRRYVEGSGLDFSMPIEVRVTAGDTIPLSMASGRESVFVAVHVLSGRPYDQYFRAVESIMQAAGGRPHWGKLHFRTAETLAPAYPAWEEFRAVRRRLDPAGVFANGYTERVLGPAG
jgi:L-gulonolactone oxidase